ncbi:MAG TPA: SRPBCC domain-containing protein [Acidimicrobiales bacterium]|nr:SRPBCC domain-containing protein [Acidimicrobiales bacterium]
MTDRNTGVVEQTVRIGARPETVWRFWTDPERMREWWGAAAALDPAPGGVCRVEMAHGAVMEGAFVELVPYERLVFTFGWQPREGGPDVPPGSSRVEVTLVDDAGDTIMTLRHSGLPASEARRHVEGWGEHLPVLVEAAERAGRKDS